MAKGRCMYCSKEDVELQTIESIFSVDCGPVCLGADVENVKNPTGSDTLTVCVAPCADVIREASEVIVRDEVFGG